MLLPALHLGLRITKLPDLPKLLPHLELVSVEKLMSVYTIIDRDVESTVEPCSKCGEAGRINFIAAA